MKKDEIKISQARRLRRMQTYAERLLWSKLRGSKFQSLKFRRQQPIGNYIVDFICFDRNLIIEIDGGQHNLSDGMLRDDLRRKALERQGYRIIRFWNNDVINNLNGVMEKLAEETK